MTNRFSTNGDGKERTPQDRISLHLSGHQPAHPDNEQQIIEALTGRYDQIEALWKEAEDDLKRFRVPHPVQHLYEFGPDGGCPIREEYSLSWARYGKGWRICHEHLTVYLDPERPDEIDQKPIIECSLDLRVRMITEFEHLRRKVIEAANNAVPALDEAISNFRKILKG